jgi:hypothetical protein
MSDTPDADQVGRSPWTRREEKGAAPRHRAKRHASTESVAIAFAGGTTTGPLPSPATSGEIDRDSYSHGDAGSKDAGKDEAAETKSQPPAVVTTRPTLDLHHFYNPKTRDHLYVTNYDSGAGRSGYEWRGTEGKIFGNAAPKTVALNGEEGRIGYVYQAHEPNTTALYYCVSGEGDLFTTREAVAAQAEYQAWRCQGIVGYVGV